MFTETKYQEPNLPFLDALRAFVVVKKLHEQSPDSNLSELVCQINEENLRNNALNLMQNANMLMLFNSGLVTYQEYADVRFGIDPEE